MKKLTYIFFVAGSLFLWSCNKENAEPASPSSETAAEMRTVGFNALSINTKAVFGEKSGTYYPVTWSSNDVAPAVSLFQSGVTEYSQATDFAVSTDGTTASFKAEAPDGLSSYTFIAVSPFSAMKSVNGNTLRVNVEIPSGQTCSTGTPDESAIILYAKSAEYSSLPSSVDLEFSHITAYLRLSFTNLSLESGETVQSVDISSDLKIAGRTFFYPADGHIEDNSMVSTITVNTDDAGNVWAGIAPVDLSGETVTFIVKTNSHTFTREVTFGSGRTLTSGKVAKLTVDMNGIAGQTPEEFVLVTDKSQLGVGDEIIIVGTNYESAMSTAQNYNNRSGAAVTKDGNSIFSPSDAVQRITLADGFVPGEYALKVGDNDYLYFATGGNYLRTKSAVDASSSWDIDVRTADTPSTHSEVGASNVAYIQEKTDGRFIRYNYSETNNLFSAYAESSGTKFVSIYRKVKDADTTPRFNVTNTSGNRNNVSVSSAEQTVEVYVFGNVAWTASVTGDATLSQSSGTGNAILEVTVPANTGDARDFTVTVSTSAAVATDTYSLTVSQAAVLNPSVTAAVGDTLFFESWAGGAKSATPSAYQQSGSASTQVFGGYNVIYSQNSVATKIYTENVVYQSNGTDGDGENLMIAKSEWWKVANIPCPGVTAATVTYRINRNGATKYTVTTDTSGLTLGGRSQEQKTSESGKTYYEVSYPITIGSGLSGNVFNLTFNNTDSSNNLRVDDIVVVVTAVAD